MMANKISLGNAGEYYVAAELERRGFSVALPMSNVEEFDILAIDRKNYKQYAIQVKATKVAVKEWILNKKNEALAADNIIYVLVHIQEDKTPEYHIVPSKILSERITSGHKKWLETPGRNGQPHNDTDIRAFRDDENEFLDRWDYLMK